MRLVLLLLLALLSGCGRPAATYAAAERLLKQGELRQAVARADAGLKSCGPSPEWCWKFRLLEAETLLLSGKPAEASALLAMAGDPPTRELQARRLMHQGQARYRIGDDYRQAERLFAAARAAAAQIPAPLLVGEVDLRLGGLFLRTERFNEADVTLRRAHEAGVRSGDLLLQAMAMGNLGAMFTDMFRFDEAVYWLQHSLELSAGLGPGAAGVAARAVGNLGVCYHRLGEAEKALAAFDEAAARFAKIGNRCAEQLWIGNGGDIYLDTENYPAAIGRFTRALAIGCSEKSKRALLLNSLALTHIETGQLDEAERDGREFEALDNKESRLDLYHRVNLAGIAAGRKQFDHAEGLFQSVVDSPAEDPTPSLDAREGLADLYAQTGRLQEAEAHFRSAISAIEGRQAGLTKDDFKLSYLASLVRFYRSYVDFLVRRGETVKALEVVESSRARILRERAAARGPTPRGFSATALQAWARSSHQILLSYWLAPRQSYLWAITPARIQVFPLPPEKEIRSLVESYRTAIEDLRDPIETRHPAGTRLSEILLGPVRDLAPAGSRVVMVADGALHSLNFNTLPSPGDPAKYWIEEVTLAVAPSLSLAVNSGSARQVSPRLLLAMGDAESPGPEYPRLRYARQEMETIAALFPDPRKAIYYGTAAHPAAYRQAEPARFSLIHFAAHASANASSPLDSALILSRDETTYALTARDIMKIPLKAGLVTLSSCHSAGAKAYSGEGLVGLTWAFLEAGAHRVVAGLWDVDDQSTAALMAGLYRGLARGASPEDALRTAQLGLLHGGFPYRKPYYWGPFQLYVGREN
ncbi:MAG: CHAT domain-containing protein [Acidobacteriia bacterium]|nr:CHAT domain-containing protein [Terriglobia bacterium]